MTIWVTKQEICDFIKKKKKIKEVTNVSLIQFRQLY